MAKNGPKMGSKTQKKVQFYRKIWPPLSKKMTPFFGHFLTNFLTNFWPDNFPDFLGFVQNQAPFFPKSEVRENDPPKMTLTFWPKNDPFFGVQKVHLAEFENQFAGTFCHF